MPAIHQDELRQKEILIQAMDEEYSYVKSVFKELAQYIIPLRYRALDEGMKKFGKERNRYILDGHATRSAKTLSAGMLFSASNPAQDWLKLSLDSNAVPIVDWVQTVEKMILGAMGRSNIYNSLASLYLDQGVFGTSAMLIYEDPQTIFRSYVLPAGEYRIMRDHRQKISYLSRKFKMTADQMVTRFGIENCSEQVQRDYSDINKSKFAEYDVYHLIEPNEPATLPEQFAFRECYWEGQSNRDMALAYSGYFEKPFVVPRWEVIGNATYGASPGMDALPDIIQLQHMTKKRGQGLDKTISPPIVADNALRNQPAALMPNGITYVPNSSQVGAKPLYTVNVPFQDLLLDKQDLKESINAFFYNDLFRALLDLKTVRSATEIEGRFEEKLALLGPVVNRQEDELLSEVIVRIFSLMMRAQQLPPPPQQIDAQLSVKYDSILSRAQKAAGISTLERYIGVVGQTAGLLPETIQVINPDELMREYGDRLGVPASVLRSRPEVAAIRQQQQQQLAAQQQALVGNELTQAARNIADAQGQA